MRSWSSSEENGHRGEIPWKEEEVVVVEVEGLTTAHMVEPRNIAFALSSCGIIRPDRPGLDCYHDLSA